MPEEPLQSLGLSLPGSAPPALPGTEDPPVQTAEFAGDKASQRCVLCRAEVADTYYHLDGNVICRGCAEQKQASLEPIRGHVFAKSVLYGAGAALAGSALYAIV